MDKLIFIISQPRSGSTLLQRLLWNHPQVHTSGEPYIALAPLLMLQKEYSTYLALDHAHRQLMGFFDELSGGREEYVSQLRGFLSALYENAATKAGKKIFVDKSPKYHNVVDELMEVFPDAEYVVLTRQPLAILSSLLTWSEARWSNLRKSIDDLVDAPHTMQKLVVQSATATNVHVVRYEDLIVEPEEQMLRLQESLSLELVPGLSEYDPSVNPGGRWNRSGNTGQFDKPSKEKIDAWKNNFFSKQRRAFAMAYLESLGPDLYTKLGYDFELTKKTLLDVPVSGLPAMYSWDTLMKEEQSWAEERWLALCERIYTFDEQRSAGRNPHR